MCALQFRVAKYQYSQRCIAKKLTEIRYVAKSFYSLQGWKNCHSQIITFSSALLCEVGLLSCAVRPSQWGPFVFSPLSYGFRISQLFFDTLAIHATSRPAGWHQTLIYTKCENAFKLDSCSNL